MLMGMKRKPKNGLDEKYRIQDRKIAKAHDGAWSSVSKVVATKLAFTPIEQAFFTRR